MPVKRVRMTRTKVATLAVCGLSLAVLLVAAWSRRWMSDDGFIYLRVVQNVRSGHGPVFNAGERVEANTGPAWVGVLALADWLSPFRLEWIAVVLGIASTVGGAAAAAAAAVTLQRRALHERGVLVPAGLVVFVAIPAVWDYASSGLETGLVFLWLGVSAWLAARWVTGDRSRPVPWWLAMLVGAGPLLRPDAALFAVGFLIALLVPAALTWRQRARIVGWAALVPVVFEVFRAGYYGALVPNTAFAKEGSTARWRQGWRYFTDFTRSYALWLPAVVVVILIWLLVRHLRATGATGSVVLVWCLVATSTTHALYTVFQGGSHMHGRLFLPALLAILIPIAVVPWRNPAMGPAVVILALWGVVCIFSLRPPPPTAAQMQYGVIDLRTYFVQRTHDAHPIAIESHVRALSAQDLAVMDTPAGRVAAPRGFVGAVAYAEGSSVYVLDVLGLGDWLTARLPLTAPFPDHQKQIGQWKSARLALISDEPPKRPDSITVAATRALECGRLLELRRSAVDALSPGRFFANMVDSVRLYSFRLPQDPVEAEQQLC